MCIGWPMQVEALRPGHATVRRGSQRRSVRTALVESAAMPLAPGDWLLVFLDDARERLTPERAAEVEATLALVEAALGGLGADPDAAPGFVLPSSLPPSTFEEFR